MARGGGECAGGQQEVAAQRGGTSRQKAEARRTGAGGANGVSWQSGEWQRWQQEGGGGTAAPRGRGEFLFYDLLGEALKKKHGLSSCGKKVPPISEVYVSIIQTVLNTLVKELLKPCDGN